MHRVFRLLFRPVDGCDIAQSVPLYPRMAEPLPALGAGIFLMLPGCQAARMVMVAARGCDAPPIGQVLEADCTACRSGSALLGIALARGATGQRVGMRCRRGRHVAAAPPGQPAAELPGRSHQTGGTQRAHGAHKLGKVPAPCGRCGLRHRPCDGGGCKQREHPRNAQLHCSIRGGAARVGPQHCRGTAIQPTAGPWRQLPARRGHVAAGRLRRGGSAAPCASVVHAAQVRRRAPLGALALAVPHTA